MPGYPVIVHTYQAPSVHQFSSTLSCLSLVLALEILLTTTQQHLTNEVLTKQQQDRMVTLRVFNSILAIVVRMRLGASKAVLIAQVTSNSLESIKHREGTMKWTK